MKKTQLVKQITLVLWNSCAEIIQCSEGHLSSINFRSTVWVAKIKTLCTKVLTEWLWHFLLIKYRHCITEYGLCCLFRVGIQSEYNRPDWEDIQFLRNWKMSADVFGWHNYVNVVHKYRNNVLYLDQNYIKCRKNHLKTAKVRHWNSIHSSKLLKKYLQKNVEINKQTDYHWMQTDNHCMQCKLL